jgi:CspA family cold shock protein
MGMPRGIIKFFSERRGYGFISFAVSQEADGKSTDGEAFVHYSQINAEGYRTLKEGQEVTFDLKESKRGLEAVNVQKLS